MKKAKIYRNPSGLSHEEFVNAHKEIRKIAELCWFIGVEPDELKRELKILLNDNAEPQSIDVK